MTLKKWNDLWNKKYKVKSEQTEFERFCKIFNLEVIRMYYDFWQVESGYECLAEGYYKCGPYQDVKLMFFVALSSNGYTIIEVDDSTGEPIGEKMLIDDMIKRDLKKFKEEFGWEYTIPEHVENDWIWT